MKQDMTPKPQGPRPKINFDVLRDKDRQLVKGIFRFAEIPGGTMQFCYKGYEGDQVQNYTMVDGEVYTIPHGVAKHLNKNGWYPEYEHFKNDIGVQGVGANMRIGKKIRRFSFQSLEFMDSDDLTPVGGPLLTVENA